MSGKEKHKKLQDSNIMQRKRVESHPVKCIQIKQDQLPKMLDLLAQKLLTCKRTTLQKLGILISSISELSLHLNLI